MPRTPTERVDVSALPEFLRSRAVGAVIAEALDSETVGSSGAVTAMITDAAAEIRAWHGLPNPDHEPQNRPTPLTPQGSDPMGYGEDMGHPA